MPQLSALAESVIRFDCSVETVSTGLKCKDINTRRSKERVKCLDQNIFTWKNECRVENQGILAALEMNRYAWGGPTDRHADVRAHTQPQRTRTAAIFFPTDLLTLCLLFIAGMSMTHTCVCTALLQIPAVFSIDLSHLFSLQYTQTFSHQHLY